MNSSADTLQSKQANNNIQDTWKRLCALYLYKIFHIYILLFQVFSFTL